MLDPLPILQNIYSVKKLIYDQTALAKGSQEQCKRLVKYIRIIEQNIHNVDQKDKDGNQKNLNDLLTELQDCLKFWFKKSARLGDKQAAEEVHQLKAILVPPTEYSLLTHR